MDKGPAEPLTRKQFDKMCKKARVKYQDFEDKVKQLELKITGCVHSEYDLDQSTLYNNFINDETQG